MLANKWLLSTVYPNVLLEMMLELKRLLTFGALKPPQRYITVLGGFQTAGFI